MDNLSPLFMDRAYLSAPGGIEGWLVLLSWAVLLVFALRAWRSYNISPLRRQVLPYLALALAVLLTSLFVGFRLPTMGALPLPNVPVEPRGPVFMVLAGIPWFLAAGFYGPLPAAVLAGLSGLLISLFDSHNPFYPLELAFLAATSAVFMRQRFRTIFFRLLRHPLLTSLILIPIYLLVYVFNTIFLPAGTLVARLDFALSSTQAATIAFAGMVLIGGVVAQIIFLAHVRGWGGQGSISASPSERSLSARFTFTMIPIAILVVLALLVGTYIVSEGAARKMLEDRMSNAVGTAISGIPFFLETGQDLILRISQDERLYLSSPDQLRSVLVDNLRTVPFFRQLYIINQDGEYVMGYPELEYDLNQAPLDERTGVQLALSGVRIQSYAIPPASGTSAAQVTFLASLMDEGGTTHGVVIGRIDLESNPLTQPVLASLKSLADLNGEGYLVDERGKILYHPSTSLLMMDYSGPINPEQPFMDQTATDGTRSLVYVSQAVGRPWIAAIWVPARQAQQLALQIAAPLLLMVVVLSLVTFWLVRIGLKLVTNSLRTLATESDRIAQGELGNPLQVEGQDEIGQLRRSFEKMRQSLKARLDDLNRLLVVSQEVASTLDLEDSLVPILKAAVASGADSARVVLTPDIFEDGSQQSHNIPLQFGEGSITEQFEYLDSQMLDMMRNQEQIVLTNPARVRTLKFEAEQLKPQAILAISLRHENRFFGCMWIGFQHPRIFSDEEIGFYLTLAGQAALATSNASLFMKAEVGRQQLAAILESTPDPVLVTDAQDRLLLANPAARQVLGTTTELLTGLPIDKVIAQADLVDLLKAESNERKSAEVVMPDEHTYLAIASSTSMNGQRAGRVCVLRDVTYFKELDTMKTDFVSTVSHDLRQPLSVIGGYATMLTMIGDLNEQQTNFVHKISSKIEEMNRLVTNLLDLGRIEAGVGLQVGLIPVREVVEYVVGTLSQQAVQKQIDLSAQGLDGSEPIIEADQALLQQALNNLVENAIKYTPAGGRVEVKYKGQQEHVQLSVSDTGIGIAAVDQSRLFEKFYRVARRGAQQQRGTGLGLAIVKSIAERHGGRVWVESQLGRGSTFSMEIPLRQPASERGKL
jgi:PAS domain S-box-containing protein